MTYTCLSIAGFDGSGGAGIQADLKTFSALGCYGMTVLTALPVQNTCGVRSCYPISLDCIREQLDAIFDDVVPSAIKIGMLFSHEIIALVATCLRERAHGIPIVLDPVMIAKSGDPLLQHDAVDALKQRLIPLATVITPNLPEARVLIPSVSDQSSLVEPLLALGCQAALVKGGHGEGFTADDVYRDRQGRSAVLSMPRVVSTNTHGTGCTLSAAIASFLAQGYGSLVACQFAKHYLHEAIVAAKTQMIGKGNGPVHHFHSWWA